MSITVKQIILHQVVKSNEEAENSPQLTAVFARTTTRYHAGSGTNDVTTSSRLSK